MPRTKLTLRAKMATSASIAAITAVAAVSWWSTAHAGSPTEATHPDPKAFADTFTTYAKVGPQQAIDDSLAGMPVGDFLSVSLQEPDPGTGPQWGQWFHSTMNIHSSDPHDSVFAGWESDLLEGAIAERTSGATTDLAQVISNAVVSGRLSDGSTVNLDGGMGDVVPGQEFLAQIDQRTDAHIIAGVRSTLFIYGLKAENVQILRPLGPALAIRATVDDVKSIAGQFYAIENALLGQPAQYEGLYLELDSSDGSPLVRVADSYRTGSNAVSVTDEAAAETLGIMTFGVQPGKANGPQPKQSRHSR